ERAFKEARLLYSGGTAESLRKAVEKYEEAIPLYRAAEDRHGEALTLNNIAVIYDQLGEGQKALGSYARALPLFRGVGDRVGEATTLTNIGAVYYNLGERQKALESFQEALPVFRAVQDQ